MMAGARENERAEAQLRERHTPPDRSTRFTLLAILAVLLLLVLAEGRSLWQLDRLARGSDAQKAAIVDQCLYRIAEAIDGRVVEKVKEKEE